MRTSDLIVSISLLGLAFGLSPAVSFDGTRAPEGSTVAVPLPGATSNLAPSNNPLGGAQPLAAVPVAPLGRTPMVLVADPLVADPLLEGIRTLARAIAGDTLVICAWSDGRANRPSCSGRRPFWKSRSSKRSRVRARPRHARGADTRHREGGDRATGSRVSLQCSIDG